MILPDANLLIYAYNEAASQREAARQWLKEILLGTETACFCWQTITAFVRVSTNKKIFGNAYSTAEALEVVENWLSAPNVRTLLPTERHFEIFKKVAANGQVSGPMLMDAHLAALAIEHGAALATTDRDFRRFDGLKIINPLAS
jgi:Predicted nucleic acid-binding protein, contains PIN domain